MGLTDFHILWSSCQRGTIIIGSRTTWGGGSVLFAETAGLVRRHGSISTLPGHSSLLGCSSDSSARAVLEGEWSRCSALDAGSRGQGWARRENLGGWLSAALARWLQLAELQIILGIPNSTHQVEFATCRRKTSILFKTQPYRDNLTHGESTMSGEKRQASDELASSQLVKRPNLGPGTSTALSRYGASGENGALVQAVRLLAVHLYLRND